MLPLLFALQSADPPTYSGLAKQLAVPVPRIDATARVDGVLDEPVWRRAARLAGFSQYRPVDGRPADDSTEVLVWYAPDAIWFGVRARERHGHVVRATLADRDNIDADDNVQILLDTYNDHRRALLFAVNPLGVQEDGVRSEGQDAGAAGGGASATGRFDGVVDLSPDFVYQSHGHLTDWGYEVEVRIPFKSLRYQSADVTPEFTSKVDGTPAGGGYDYRGTPELGGNVRWGISQNLGLAATAHPDFSQVEADVGQVTVNERFALFYPEKRPFFLEGLEQFDTPNRMIYTRQIVQPVAGTKLTGKVGGTAVAYLGAVDDHTQSAAGSNPVYNLLRLRRDLGASSTAGLVYTDRIDGDDYNRVLGGDAMAVWKKIWFSQGQLVSSWTSDADGARAGQFWAVTFADRTGRNYGNHFELLGATPRFATRSGFVNRVDFVQARLANRFTWYGRPGALVEQVTTFIVLLPLWRYDDFFRLRGIFEGGPQMTWTATLRGGWNLNTVVANGAQRFAREAYAGYGVDRTVDTISFAVPHGLYNLWSVNGGVGTPNRAFTFTANVGYGATAIFAEAAAGRQLVVQATAGWKPTPAVRIEGRWAHVRLTRGRDGSRFSTANIPRLKLEYQLSRAVFFRYVGQYVAQDQVALEDPRTGQPLVVNGNGAAAVLTNDFRNDVLFSYKPLPGTLVFFGYGTSLVEPEAFRFQNLSRASDGFFLKISYLLRM